MYDFSPVFKYMKYYLWLVLIVTLTIVNLSLKADIYSLNNEQQLNTKQIHTLETDIQKQQDTIHKLNDPNRLKSIAKELNLKKSQQIKI